MTAGMLDVMETPAHERRQIEEYLRAQSGDDFEIEHVESSLASTSSAISMTFGMRIPVTAAGG